MDVYGADLIRQSDAASAFAASGGGGDAWTRVGLASDFQTGAITFSTITGFSTGLALGPNTNFTIEAEILLVTVGTTNLPRLGFSWNQTLAYAIAELEYDSAAAAKVFANFFGLTSAGVAQMAAGSAPSTTAYLARCFMKGRTGAAATTAIQLQLAAEAAATNAATAKVGSEFRYRAGP